MTTATVPSASGANAFRKLASKFDVQAYNDLSKTLTFAQYLAMVYENPVLCQSAYQRLYRMIISKGSGKISRYGRTIPTYNFFTECDYPIFGLEENLEQFVKAIRGAAGYFGTEKRILLFHGPVGSSKSTICRSLKKGLESYTKSPEGALYTYEWFDLPAELDDMPVVPCPMHDDPIKLVPSDIRLDIQKELNEILADKDNKISDMPLRLQGELNPQSQFYMDFLMGKYDGNWEKVIENHIRVKRVVLSESRRIGIGTFQPKDEKNQDSTELTGDVNYRRLGQFGKDSDPRAFNFDGEFEVAHRGVLEFIEVLKLAPEFLYDLLGATQERSIKPKKFSQVDIDVALLSHTNNPEFVRLQQNDRMEALRDRTVRIDIPYLLRWSDEIKVLQMDYNKDKVRQHIAPHTIEIAALWAICTRLTLDNEGKLDLVTKAKLYDGRNVPGLTEDAVKEMRDRNPGEGMKRGMSARYVQNKISNALVGHHDYVNPFMVLNEIEEGLKHYSLIADEELKAFYATCVTAVKKELAEILKNEVQRALVADEDSIKRLFNNYLDNVFAFIEGTKVKNAYTQEYEQPDERLMRSIEEKIEISEVAAEDFRRMIASFVGNIVRNEGKDALTWDRNPELARALELKLFEDTRDTIKLSSMTTITQVVDKDLARQINDVKERLIRNYGYNEQSAKDVLNYVSSIFARGDMKQ